MPGDKHPLARNPCLQWPGNWFTCLSSCGSFTWVKAAGEREHVFHVPFPDLCLKPNSLSHPSHTMLRRRKSSQVQYDSNSVNTLVVREYSLILIESPQWHWQRQQWQHHETQTWDKREPTVAWHHLSLITFTNHYKRWPAFSNTELSTTSKKDRVACSKPPPLGRSTQTFVEILSMGRNFSPAQRDFSDEGVPTRSNEMQLLSFKTKVSKYFLAITDF